MSHNIKEDPRGCFTQAEQTVMLNNAVAMAKLPAGGAIPEARLSALRKFSEAILETIEELQDEGHLRPQESVFALQSLALMVQLKYVTGNAQLPTGVVSAETLAAIKRLVSRK